jgi:D-alanyl-lipoteichoic acid acyltransferase DltB (MBOAT superfamily)
MVFSSITFLFYFLPLFLALYFAAPTTPSKNIVALGSSLLFYAWGEPRAIVVLLASIAFNMIAALLIDAREARPRAIALAIAVSANIAVLAVFKYAGFLAGNLNVVMRPLGLAVRAPDVDLPLGISFFTFHCLSYVIDVYRRRFPANRHLTEVALYIALFPQLVAGPIVRYKTVARQLRWRRHSVFVASTGARIFIIGLAQKVLIADPIAPLVRLIFDDTLRPNMETSWLGLLGYSLQIYFDFAGYSNMAVGLGLIMGFSLPRNFRLPYTAQSISEFWRRWHISLSSWLRDYLYIPLGGSRRGDRRTYINLVTVFLLCGLWHGASWNFVLWGAWHGAFLIMERLAGANLGFRPPAVARWVYATLVVMGGWVLFRANDAAHASDFYAGLVGGNGLGAMSFNIHMQLQPAVALALVSGCVLAVAPRWIRLRAVRGWPGQVAGEALTLGLLLLAMLQVAAASYSPFLYFRF